MKIKLFLLFCVLSNLIFSQKIEFETLLKDKISIRAIQIWNGKVWYAGTQSKFGYVSLKDSAKKKQFILSEQKLEFRTLAQDSKSFMTIDIDSIPQLFTINKKTLKISQNWVPGIPKSRYFFDAFMFDKADRGLAISDPHKSNNANFFMFVGREYIVDKNWDFQNIFPEKPTLRQVTPILR